MLSISHNYATRLEFCILHDVKPHGHVIGRFGDLDFTEQLVDARGRILDFVGVAPKTPEGQFDLSALRAREFILRPGLVYRYK